MFIAHVHCTCSSTSQLHGVAGALEKWDLVRSNRSRVHHISNLKFAQFPENYFLITRTHVHCIKTSVARNLEEVFQPNIAVDLHSLQKGERGA